MLWTYWRHKLYYDMYLHLLFHTNCSSQRNSDKVYNFAIFYKMVLCMSKEFSSYLVIVFLCYYMHGTFSNEMMFSVHPRKISNEEKKDLFSDYSLFKDKYFKSKNIYVIIGLTLTFSFKFFCHCYSTHVPRPIPFCPSLRCILRIQPI